MPGRRTTKGPEQLARDFRTAVDRAGFTTLEILGVLSKWLIWDSVEVTDGFGKSHRWPPEDRSGGSPDLPTETEKWRDVVGCKGYLVSNLGRVQGPRRILKPQSKGNSYPKVLLRAPGTDRKRQRTRYVHLLVARAFIGPCPRGMEVNHKDGNGENFKLSNLEHLTHADNLRHAYRIGLRRPVRGKRGEDSHFSKLKSADVEEIRRRAGDGELQKSLATEFDVARATVSLVVNRQTWRDK